MFSFMFPVYVTIRHQLDLLAQMCQEQQYLAINPPSDKKLMNISQELPIDLVLRLSPRPPFN